MKDRLPQITIKIETTHEEFLRRIETLAKEIGEYLVEAEWDVVDATKVAALKIRPIMVTQHRELVGWIIPVPGAGSRVSLEVRAARWHPDPPTYKVYVEAARDIFKPLMRHYNSKYNTSRKLQIQSRSATEPRLPVMASQIFDEFVEGANKSALRNRDWQRFYHFIFHCTAHNVLVSRDDIHRLLMHGGFSIEHAADLADIFEHGRNLLLHRRKRDKTKG